MRVPFNDLSVPTNQVKTSFLKKTEKLLQDKSFILGVEVEEFEKKWAEKCGTAYCVGVSSGADALYLGLLAAGINPGDEVITQGNGYNASVVAILRLGAVPRFADILEDSLTLDVSKVEPLINSKTKAILPVHLYGQTCNMEKLMEIADKFNLKVIEDCAQAHLAEYSGRKVGSWGKVGAFSFYPTKNLGAFGDAGAITTDDKKVYDEILARRNLGQTAKNEHGYLGFNMRLDPVQAIALNLKLKYLEENNQARQAAARYYDQLFASVKLPIKPQERLHLATHVYHLYVVMPQAHDRGELMKKLTLAGVETAVHYPIPVYSQPFYNGTKDPCPTSDLVSSRILSLPLFAGITPEQQEYLVNCLKEITS